MRLEDGDIPIDAPPLNCPLNRCFLGPIHPQGVLQAQSGLPMRLPRSVTFDLVRCKFDLIHCLKIPNSSTID